MAASNHLWSLEATGRLIGAWGGYVVKNRGNLSETDWQVVANAVNDIHMFDALHLTVAQCKNRIQEIRAKFLFEKGKIDRSNGLATSSWLLYSRVEHLFAPDVDKPEPVATDMNQLVVADLNQPEPVATDMNQLVVADLNQPRPLLPDLNQPWPVAEGSADKKKKKIDELGKMPERMENLMKEGMAELKKDRMEFEAEVANRRTQLLADFVEQTSGKKRKQNDGSL